MDNKEMEKRELDPEEMDQVSGGTGDPCDKEIEDVMDRIKLVLQGREIRQTQAETQKGREYVQLPPQKLY